MNPYESPTTASEPNSGKALSARRVWATLCSLAAGGCYVWLALFAAELRSHQFFHPQGMAALAVLGFPAIGFTFLAIGLWFGLKRFILIGTVAVVPSIILFGLTFLMRSL